MDNAKSTQGNARGKPFAPGNPGRPKGSANKVTQEFRDTVRKLLEDNADNVAVWLQQVASGEHNGRPDPAKALDLLAGLAEFAAPKLSRTEVTGADGGDIKQSLTVEFIKGSKDAE